MAIRRIVLVAWLACWTVVVALMLPGTAALLAGDARMLVLPVAFWCGWIGMCLYFLAGRPPAPEALREARGAVRLAIRQRIAPGLG